MGIRTKLLMVVLLLGSLLPLPRAWAGGSATIVIEKIRFDPPGKDDLSNRSRNGEVIVLRNQGSGRVNLRGWQIRDGDRATYRFGRFNLQAGGKVVVHTGRGSDTRSDVYWNHSSYVWDNRGETARLRDGNGGAVSRCSYESYGDSTICVEGTDGEDIQAAIGSYPSGTTFSLSGHFRVGAPIIPKEGNTFVGPALIEGVDGNDTGFDMRSPPSPSKANVTIDGLEIYGFQLRAIECSDGTIVRNSYLHHNLRNGVGCGNSVGVLIQGNEIAFNGSAAELGDGAGGIKMAASGDRGRGIGTIVRNNHVHDNTGNGIWFDVDSGGDLVVDNRVTGNGRRGIYYEVSRGPGTIRGNTVTGNNTEGLEGGAGIGVTSSKHVTVKANTFDNNASWGIDLGEIDRGYPLDDIAVLDNDLNGDPIDGCELDGVTCQSND